jgi:hypothetical protein
MYIYFYHMINKQLVSTKIVNLDKDQEYNLINVLQKLKIWILTQILQCFH